MKTLGTLFVFLLGLSLLQGCNSSSDGSTVTSGTYSITIVEPAADLAPLGKNAILAGDCGFANYPIRITGDITLYTICQSDFTWSAPISGDGFATDQVVTVNATLWSPDYTTSSSTVTRTFQKEDIICDVAANLTKTFGNIDDGANGTTVPYKICTPTQLANMALYPSAKFQLGRNIDFNYAKFTPILPAFSGELDGKGYTIQDMLINEPSATSVGLFKYGSGGTIKNLKIKNVSVVGSTRVGALAGDWRGLGTIDNVVITGNVNGTDMIGGLIGLGNTNSQLTITNSQFDIDVTGRDFIGGVVGYVFGNTTPLSMTNVDAYTDVSGRDYVGGVVGRLWLSTTSMTDVQHKGVISSTGKYVGGLIGEDYHGSTISNSRNIGTITVTRTSLNKDMNVGGLIGVTRATTNISNSYVVNNITMGGDYAGGLVGRYFGGSITNSYSRGSIVVNDTFSSSVSRFAGGLAGTVNTNSTVSGSYSLMSVSAVSDFVGGLFGFMGGATSSISHSYSVGDVTGQLTCIGGLVGQFTGANIDHSFSESDITITNPAVNTFAGGIVGYVNNTATFDMLYNRGDISISGGTANYAGGAFGYAGAGSIAHVYTSGTITGANNYLGGVAGYLKAPLDSAMSHMNMTGSGIYSGGIAGIAYQKNVSNVFFSGSLAAAGYMGGIAGWYAPNSTQLSNAYVIGSVSRINGSSYPDSSIGAIGGTINADDVAGAYYIDSINLYDLESSSALTSPNYTGGSALSDSQLQNSSNYTGFNFSGDWVMPSAGFKLPTQGTDYLYAVMTWMDQANFGFSAPVTYGDDPISEANPELIPGISSNESLAQEFGQDLIDNITSGAPIANVTPGNLEISIEYPAVNGETILNRMLVWGECGQAGNAIEVSGDFALWTVCQANNRWAAVIDAASLPTGSLTLSVDLKNSSLGAGSSVVSRTLDKPSSSCTDPLALSGEFGNSHSGADGVSTPYAICSKGQFQNMSSYPSKKFELGTDIDFAGSLLSPMTATFTGQLDGKGFRVKNFVINSNADYKSGIFKNVGSGAILKDIQFLGFQVTGESQTGVFAGIWEGIGTIQDVTLQGSVTGTQYVGGLIGQADSNSDLTLSNIISTITVNGYDQTGGLIGAVSSNTGSFSATNITLHNTVSSTGISGYVGGFVGQLAEPNATINSISQDKNVTATGLNIGGMIGAMAGGSINNCNMNGNVTVTVDGNDGYIGGVIGSSSASTTINTCSYNGTVHAGSDHVGGVIGFIHSGSMTLITSAGTIDVDDNKYNVPRSYVGGIIGRSENDFNLVLTNSSSSMNINAEAQYVGGVAGRIAGNGSTMTNVFATGNINAQVKMIGGLAGFHMGDVIEDCYATGTVTVTNPTPSAYIGGLIGYTNSLVANHKRLHATGSINVTGGTADYVGGLVGFFRGGALEDSYANGNLTGDAIRNSSGGLIGMMRGSLDSSYSTGDVVCKGTNCGGLLGYLLNSTLTNSFATGDVDAFGRAGGLVGYINTSLIPNSVQYNYATGVVSRASGSSESLSFFGPLMSDQLVGGSFDNTTNYYINENLGASHNTNGTGINFSDAPNTGSYGSFAFASATDDWMAAPIGYEITTGVDYDYPILDWMGGGGGGSATFTVSGTLAGLEFDSIDITLNGSETINKAAGQTSFAFSTLLANGQTYSVTITTQPSAPPITCLVSNGIGTIAGGNVTNVSVACPTVTAIDLVIPAANLNLGNSQQLQVNATFSDASVQDIAAYASYGQSPTGYFSIDGNGLMQATAPGSSTISAGFLTFSDNGPCTAVAVPVSLAYVVQPASASAGASIAPSIQVEVRDYYGNRVTSANNSITLSFGSDPSSGTATLAGTKTVAAVAGVATFNNISINKAFSGYTLNAASSGLTGATSSSFNISAGAKAALAFNVQPLGALAGASFSPFSVKIVDAYGNLTTATDSITLAFQNNPGGGSATLSGTKTKAAVSGIATFNNISINFATSGYTLRATATGLTTAISNSFNITSTPTKLMFLSQPTHTLESANIAAFQVAITDNFNNVITTSSASISLNIQTDPSSGSASLGGTYSKNAVNGVVTFNDIYIDTAASGYTLRATSGGLANATSNGFNILLSAPDTLELFDPVATPSEDATPTITVYGVENTDTVALYTNSFCNPPSVASYTATGTSINMTTSLLAEGTYTFYADRLSSGGIRSACSTANVVYQVLNPFEQLDNLDASFGNWSNVGGDDADWSLNTGDTPSTDVGPTTGSYAYTEASSPVAANDVFLLESNILDGSTYDLAFSFKWNKRGNSMGNLYLQASNNGGSSWSTVWQHLGADIATGGADVWRNQAVDLCNLGYNSGNVKLRFRAVMPSSGTVWNSDIGIDDLHITSAGCEAAPPATIAFTTPAAGTKITLFNHTAFTIGGTCSDNGQNIVFSGNVTGSTSCSGGNWSATLDVSSAGDGTVQIIATHSSSGGGANGVATRSFSKDTSYIQIDNMNSFGNWSNVGYDDQDWTINSGDTPSTGVGPTDAQDTGGFYAYTESSSPTRKNEVFILESNDLDASLFDLRFNFYWNKRGTNMGNLYVDVSTNGGSSWSAPVWSHIGKDVNSNGTDIWRSQSIDLCNLGYTSGNVRLRIRGVMPSGGTVWNSDMAIDQLKFTNNGCNTGTPATIAITSPDPASTFISLLNQTSFGVSGTCSDNAQNITFSGSVSGSTICSSGTWSYVFNVSAIPDGDVTIIADHIAASGGPSGRDTKVFTKDTSLLQVDEFDSFVNWSNIGGDDGDWTLNSGDTPSSGVGPSDDYTGGGSYVYTEASSPVGTNDVFLLRSNSLAAGTYNLKVDFKWNKRGNFMGDLYLEVSTDGGSNWQPAVWSHLGTDVAQNDPDIWRSESVDLCSAGYTSGNIMLRFRAVMPSSGTVWHSDMALDHIEVKTTGCP